MINKEPSKVIQELFDPLKHADDSSMDQLGITDKEMLIHYSVQNPLLKGLVMERIYSFFLYPPACLCDPSKEKCLCDQKRQETYKAQSIEAYKLHLNTRDKFSDFAQQEVQSKILFLQHLYGLSQEQARQCHLHALNNTHELLQKQCQTLTGIQSEKELIALIGKLANTEAMNWRTKLNLKTNDKRSSYSIAIGIGQRLLTQIFFLRQHDLKTAKGRHGFLSLNRVITDVLEGNSLECFYGLKHPKRKIENAWYQYRSILHLILGHIAAKSGFLGEDKLEIGQLTFIASYHIQKFFLDSSLKTFTPHHKSALFSDKNVACVPSPSTFVVNYPMIHENLIFMLSPQGIPVLCRKDEEKTLLDRYQNRSS